MGSETALILKPPQARGASSAWPIRGIMERCRAPGMAKNSLYRGLPSRCQNPGCIYRYICKFVAKVQPGSVCLQRNRRFCVNEQQAGVRASARRLPDGSIRPALFWSTAMHTSTPLAAQQLAAYAAFAQTLADRVRPLSRQWFRHPVHRHQGRREPGHPPRPTAKSKPRCGRLFRSSTRARHFWRRVWRSRPRRNSWVAGPHRRYARLHFRQSPLGHLAGVAVPGQAGAGLDRCADAGRALDRYAGGVSNLNGQLCSASRCKPDQPFCMRLRPISSIPPNWPHSTPWRVRRACVAMAAIATAMACSPAAMSTWWSRRDCSL